MVWMGSHVQATGVRVTILALLCATAQRSSCRHAGVRGGPANPGTCGSDEQIKWANIAMCHRYVKGVPIGGT